MPHNHNDIGTYIIVAGDESFVVDPGFSVYNDITFSKNRYSIEVLSSYGHSVPVVAGCEQGPAIFESLNTNYNENRSEYSYDEVKYYGKVIDKSFSDVFDTITYDLSKAYECSILEKLHRKMTFDRIKEEVIIEDEFAYSEEAEFETAIITYKHAEITREGKVLLKGVNNTIVMEILADDYSLDIACVEGAVTGNHDIIAYPVRIAIKVKAVRGSIRLQFSK